MRLVTLSLVAWLLASCATGEVPVEERIARADPAVSVQAKGETTPVGTSAADAADDPAIWRNSADPSASLIIGTDKKAGLYVYGMEGRTRSFLDAGRVNNVDLRDGVNIGNGAPGVLVVASDRNDLANAKLALFRLDPATARLERLGTVSGGAGEAYGVCLYRAGADLFAFLVLKDGTIRQVLLNLSGAAPTGTVVRTMKLATQSEGCAVDERTGRLYVAEEDRGLWRFDARPDGSAVPTLVAGADSRRLVADVEGVALATEGGTGGFLIVSSQGDNAYAVWRLADESFVGRFRITPGALGATQETDGIGLALGDFGSAYPGGLFVAQDGENEPAAQNFKLVAWADIAKALKLPEVSNPRLP